MEDLEYVPKYLEWLKRSTEEHFHKLEKIETTKTV